MSEKTIGVWRREQWWEYLWNATIKERYQDFQMDLAANAETFSKALKEVAEGKNPTDRTATARVQAAKTFAEIGPHPALDRRSQVQIQNNSLTNYGTINVANLKEKLQGKGSDEMLKIITGETPLPE